MHLKAHHFRIRKMKSVVDCSAIQRSDRKANNNNKPSGILYATLSPAELSELQRTTLPRRTQAAFAAPNKWAAFAACNKREALS